MSIRRQYSLPNCTLTLEGFSNEIGVDFTSGMGTLHTLTKAECLLPGRSQPLSGGQEFFEQLVTTVSAYAQECLSGLRTPVDTSGQKERVELTAIPETQHHQLVWHTEDSAESVRVELTTVQLFDLVEAIDQFFADTTTLPELTLSLKPVSRRYRREEEPLVQRAIPVVLGAASLVIAGFALFQLPIPDVEEPEPGLPRTEETNPSEPIAPGALPPEPSNGSTAGEPIEVPPAENSEADPEAQEDTTEE